MESWLQVILTVFSSVLASSGLWAFVVKRAEKKDVKTQMLIGLGHDRIMDLGMKDIERVGLLQMNMKTFMNIFINHMR